VPSCESARLGLRQRRSQLKFDGWSSINKPVDAANVIDAVSAAAISTVPPAAIVATVYLPTRPWCR
jgi:hypothetical protein